MIERSDFGKGPQGEPVHLFKLTGPGGLSVRITNYGGIITHLHTPDRAGKIADITLGFDTLQPYLAGHPYFGAIVGRIAGRLTPGALSIEGTDYPLSLNQPPHHLHGGHCGFDKRVWDADIVAREDGVALRLSYLSPDGEEGYPGNVKATVCYSITETNGLLIDYSASTDKTTPLSLTNHAYFNLLGESAGGFGSHELQVLADEFTPVAPDMTHTGERRDVDGTANDFRKPVALGARLESLAGRHGESYLLGPRRTSPMLAARVVEPECGRTLDVLTTSPCLQFYTGVSLDGSCAGKSGRPYGQFAGFCLECHGYPAAPHYPSFESIMLHPGETYSQRTIYRFGVI